MLDQIALAVRLVARLQHARPGSSCWRARSRSRGSERLYQSVILKALGATRGFVSRVLRGGVRAPRRRRRAGRQRAGRARWPGAVLRWLLEVPWRWQPGTLAAGVATATRARARGGLPRHPAPARPPAARRACEASDAGLERLRALYPEASGRSLKQWLEAGRVRGQRPVAPGRAARRWPRDDTRSRSSRRAGRAASRAAFARPRGRDDPRRGRQAVRPAHRSPPSASGTRTAYRSSGTTSAAKRQAAAVHRPPPRPRDLGAARLRQVASETSGRSRRSSRPAAWSACTWRWSRAAPPDERGHPREHRSRRIACCAVPVRREKGRARPSPTTACCERRREATLLELALGTGRRHQIRVQLAALGHPIVGDVDHGSPRGALGRLCLHATRLGFVHPGDRAARRLRQRAARRLGIIRAVAEISRSPPLTLPSTLRERKAPEALWLASPFSSRTRSPSSPAAASASASPSRIEFARAGADVVIASRKIEHLEPVTAGDPEAGPPLLRVARGRPPGGPGQGPGRDAP